MKMDNGNIERMKQLAIITKAMTSLLDAVEDVDKTKIAKDDEKMLGLINEMLDAWGFPLATVMLDNMFGVKELYLKIQT